MDYQHQLSLLIDILKNQKYEHYGTSDEYNQIQRLTESLINNESIDPNLKQTLMSIEQYSNQGTSMVQDDVVFDNWITMIEETK
ncbi:YtzH-like family protein [Anaerobacillus sp. MEB173]|uniref:YtzH-like family protein n=1 Tax=Anaerobacillus sp. MEB173 TaxID=3383345 RepID=UPI003F8E7D61